MGHYTAGLVLVLDVGFGVATFSTYPLGYTNIVLSSQKMDMRNRFNLH